jgi:lipoprotein-anchoring transpeptidase ErfK/SrfK
MAAVGTGALALTGIALVAHPALASRDAPQAASPSASATPTPPRASTDLKIVSVSPSPGTYGTGIVVRVRFDQPVPESARDAAIGHITLSTSKPIAKAAWAWTDSQTAVYRPKAFWPSNTKVEIHAYKTLDVIHSTEKSDLAWAGEADRTFTVGRSQVIKVDSATYSAKVIRDGVTIRTMPVSLGKQGWETRSGIKVLMEDYKVKEMTGASIGAEDDYTLQVPYAIRMTNSGEFMHGAPWAAANIGNRNGSHGCTNLNMVDAQWLFEHHLYGDPVVTTGTGRGMEADNGAGGVWNIPWSTWASGTLS